MAKIKLGMAITEISGKLGGHVFAKNRGGAYVRTKTTPINPQTTDQMSVRGIFAAISSRWSSIGDASRLSFNNLVTAYATTDIFGDIRNPSGKALFQRLNQNLALSGQSQISDCISPLPVPFSNLQTAEFNSVAGTFDISAFGNTSGSQMLVFATPPLSQGTTFVKNKLRLIDTVAGSTVNNFDIKNEYVAKFGFVPVGANMYVGLKVINENGQASPLETVKVIYI